MIELITVSSHRPQQNYYCYDEFFAACRVQKVKPVVLGENGSYKGLISKPKLLLNYLKNNLNRKKYTLFADCWDLVFTKNLEEILELFKTFNTEIVFNAERNLFPRGDLLNLYPEVGTPYRFLNSGFFVGITESIIGLLDSMDLNRIPDDFRKSDGSWHHENDQAYFLEIFTKQPVPMKLDTNCLIAQTLHGEELKDFCFDNKGCKNLITGTYPVVWHANGGGKTGEIMPKILDSFRKGLL
jgi:hypothetical protein